ncbi:MAG: helix-turn-helix transcriptional regulator [Lachnospiraceae bacterium]|nr:helix-turn-helix transcriptional regulator [Lachnospiraceae bacterium]
MISVGDRLKEVRESYNETHPEKTIKQKDMAKFAHVNTGTISRAESGKSQPSSDILIAYAEKFNVSTDYLLGMTSAKRPGNNVLGKIGLSDEAIKTYEFIKGISSDTQDYLSILNAFLSDREQTYNLLNNIIDFLSRKYNRENNLLSYGDASSYKVAHQNEQMLDALMLTSFLQQIQNVVEPKTKKSIQKHIDEKIMILDQENTKKL